jgi:protein ImuB
MKLFEEKLGELDPGFGVELMILSAPEVEEWTGSQDALPEAAVRNPLAEDGTIDLADRLALRLGKDNVVRLLPRDSHIPERVQTTAPISAPAAAEGAWARLASMKGARPTRLLQRPEPVEVTALLPDEPPRQFTWRRHAHKVVKVEGPERIADEWWRPRPTGKVMPANIVPPARDYYRIEDNDGGRFWLFRDGPLNAAKWFLHGFCA